jgi:uncharacterized protein
MPQLPLEPCRKVRCAFHGLVGQRLAANLEQWLLVAPQANPAMLEMFRDRERLPRRDLVPWAGEFAGKYLTSAVLAWRLSPDERLRAQIDRFVDEFIAVQDADGYLGPFPRHARLTGKTLDGKYDLWDVWGHYHALLGLLLWYREVGYAPTLAACQRAAEHLCARFLDGSQRVRDAGAEEMNMAVSHALAMLYQETHAPRTLRLVRAIEADWEVPPAGDYVRTALAGVPFYQTPKPRWESLHDIQALLTLYEIDGDERYRRAFERIWRSIRAGDRHNTGGFSSGEQATGNPYDPRAIETCCTVAWMALSVDMLRLTGDAAVADELELSFFNAALGAQAPSGRWWTYNTPMDGVRRASAHEIVFQAREGSPELNCCSVNGPRSLGMLSEWALMQDARGLVLNYYGPCTLTARLPSGSDLRLTQSTDYPCEGSIALTLSLPRPERLTLRLRIPAWSHATRVRLNGDPLAGAQGGSYLPIERVWHDGDRIDLELDMPPRAWVGAREAAGKVSLYRGPLLLAYDRRFNALDPDDLPPVAPAGLAETPLAWQGSAPAPARPARPTARGCPRPNRVDARAARARMLPVMV